MKRIILLLKAFIVISVAQQSSHCANGQKNNTSKKSKSRKERVSDHNKAKEVTAEPLIEEKYSEQKGKQVRENRYPFSPVFPEDDNNRYQSIKIDAEAALNEIDFWIHQISEHALFLYLGLEDQALKNEAHALHQQFEKFREQLAQGKNGKEFLNSIVPVVKQQRDFQIAVAKKLDQGQWIGWLFPTYVNHITLELDYFVDKINGIPYTPEEEAEFWNRISAEHAGLDAHLLDPSEEDKIAKAQALSENLQQIPQSETEMYIKISLKGNKELHEFHKKAKQQSKTTKSIIHPLLLEHEIREEERAIKTLQNAGMRKENPRKNVL